MAKNKNSETLNSVLSEKVDSDILAKLENLKSLGLDSDIFGEFHQRVMWIIWENPNASEVIAWELEKTALSVEDLFAKYDWQINKILKAWSMDENFIQAANDEEYSTNQRQKNLDISSNWLDDNSNVVDFKSYYSNQRQNNLDISSNWDDNSNVVDFTAYNTTSFKDPLYWIENEEEDDETGDDQQDAA